MPDGICEPAQPVLGIALIFPDTLPLFDNQTPLAFRRIPCNLNELTSSTEAT